MIIGIAAAGAAVAAVIGAILFFSVQKREEIPAQQSEEAVQEASHKSDGAEILNEDEQPKDVTEVPLYTIEDVPAVAGADSRALGGANRTVGVEKVDCGARY